MRHTKRPFGQQKIEEMLQEAGINPTAQRIAICQYVFSEADHPTADQIKEWADRHFPKMSRATVYNTVKTLVDAGILSEFKFPHSDAAVYDRNTSIHYHFLDEKTGQLIDLTPEEVKVELKLKNKLKINDVSVLLRGTKG